jgi:DNA mismatch endonuclease (patch repair protein)
MTDYLTPEQRSMAMSRVKSKDTSLERLVRSELHKQGYRFRKNVPTLPGKPDIVFVSARVVVFVDGDFWHGYHFQCWGFKLKPYWREKIETNRSRDLRNLCKLRRRGWKVLRVWGHEIKKDVHAVVQKIATLVAQQKALAGNRGGTR